MATFVDRLKAAFNVFNDRDPKENFIYNVGNVATYPIHRTQLSLGTERSIITSIYNRCALDISMLKFGHVRVDENGNYVEDIDSEFNRCLTLTANVDQASDLFLRDVVISMFDEGHVAIIPIVTSTNPDFSGSFDILNVRTAKIEEWYPQHVRVKVYNEWKGVYDRLLLPKSKVAIVENPLYSVMNEPNSTMKRLINKLNLLDAIDEQSGSGKLDIIIKLPYVIKTEARKKLADERLANLEAQLKDSKHGIAYVDSTEQVIQLNRPVENKLLEQIEYLTRMLYSQLGLTEAVFAGTATEEEMLNYHNRTIFPIAKAIVMELKRKFLSSTAITQKQSIEFHRKPFSLVTATNLAEIADKFTRNEILTGNEMRGLIGFRPSEDPGADELRNKNLNVSNQEVGPEQKVEVTEDEGE